MIQDKEILEVIAACFQGNSDKISQFTQTGYSFEEWLNWEAYCVCIKRGWKTSPKPEYKAIQFKNSKNQADLLVEPAPDLKVIIECGLIHDYTQSRWRDKLEKDHKKLEPPYGKGFVPIQMVCVASKRDFSQLEDWTKWLNKISFWNQLTVFEQKIPLQPTGIFMIKAWRI